MRSENPDTERETAAPGRGIGIPATFSVLLHVVVLALFARATFAPPAEGRIPDERPQLRVVLVTRSPPPQVPENLTQETETDPDLQVAGEVTAATDTAEAVGAEPLPAVIPDSGFEESVTESGATVPVWTPASIRAAVGTHVSKQQGTLIETWVSDCILEQKQRGTRDCERLQQAQDPSSASASASARAGRDAAGGTFAVVTRRHRHALLTEGFVKENSLIKDLMEVSGELGQLAAERYYLNREYILYLNGNPSPYGPANQFNCKGNPCVYEYTGFVVQRPESATEENAFRVVPTLFGSPR